MAYDKEIVSLTAFCEASNASPFERRCVIHTMVNRLKLKRYGLTLAEVCLKRYQFSEWNDDPANNSNLMRGARTSDNDVTLMDCEYAYNEIIGSGAFDPTKGATHYHDKSISPPLWTSLATLALTTEKFVFYSNVP